MSVIDDADGFWRDDFVFVLERHFDFMKLVKVDDVLFCILDTIRHTIYRKRIRRKAQRKKRRIKTEDEQTDKWTSVGNLPSHFANFNYHPTQHFHLHHSSATRTRTVLSIASLLWLRYVDPLTSSLAMEKGGRKKRKHQTAIGPRPAICASHIKLEVARCIRVLVGQNHFRVFFLPLVLYL